MLDDYHMSYVASETICLQDNYLVIAMSTSLGLVAKLATVSKSFIIFEEMAKQRHSANITFLLNFIQFKGDKI